MRATPWNGSSRGDPRRAIAGVLLGAAGLSCGCGGNSSGNSKNDADVVGQIANGPTESAMNSKWMSSPCRTGSSESTALSLSADGNGRTQRGCSACQTKFSSVVEISWNKQGPRAIFIARASQSTSCLYAVGCPSSVSDISVANDGLSFSGRVSFEDGSQSVCTFTKVSPSL